PRAAGRRCLSPDTVRAPDITTACGGTRGPAEVRDWGPGRGGRGGCPYTLPAMAFEPVLTTRIPLEADKRQIVWYDEYVRTGGYESLKKAIKMTPDEIIKLVTDSGLRGRGGAGFSAGQKWSFIPKEKKGPHYLAVNGDESEPGTFKDRYLIDYDPHQM